MGAKNRNRRPEPGAAAPAPEPAPAEPPAAAPPKWTLSQHCNPRLLPWWCLFFAGIFFLAKAQILLDSPCAVLGLSSPATRSQISRAYRSLTLCTHPDKLPPENRPRGQVLFARATRARDALMHQMAPPHGNGKEVICRSNEIETVLMELGAVLWDLLQHSGWNELKMVGSSLCNYGWSVITLEEGLVNSVLSALFFVSISKFVLGFFRHLSSTGPVGLVLSVLSSAFFAVVPTVAAFLASPFLRLYLFLRLDLVPLLCRHPKPAHDPSQPTPETIEFVPNPVIADTSQLGLCRGLLANMSRKITPASPESFQNVNPELAGMLVQIKTLQMRHASAQEVTFDALITLTKPVIPLAMLVATGTVFNGAIAHLLIGQALRNLVPALAPEMLHLISFLSGISHSLLGASAAHIESLDGLPTAGIQLAWQVSFRDIVAVANMAQLGAMFSAFPGLGNEPSFSASLSAGIALRILLSEAVTGGPYDHSFARFMKSSFNVVLANSQEVTARAVPGVGDCAGGPVSMVLQGGGAATAVLGLCCKLFLVAIPLLCALQWGTRAITEFRYGQLFSWKRAALSGFLGLANLAQCLLLLVYRLDSPNGPLGNFWVLVLLGCGVESLLSVYDLRGNLRQAIFLMIYIGMP